MPSGSVVLHCRGGAWDLPSLCPASVSVEAYLRFSGVSFSVSPCSSPSTSPSGSLPVLEVGDDLIGIGSSGTEQSWQEEWLTAASIIAHLRKSRPDTDAALGAHERALTLAYGTLVESKLTPATVYFTWVNKHSWRTYTQAAYGAGLPFPASYLVPWSHRRAVLPHFHNADEDKLAEDAAAVYSALASQLTANGPYLLGSKPSSLDATVFAHLLFHRTAPVSARLRAELNKHEVLTQYVQHIHTTVFSRPAPAPPVDNPSPASRGDSSHSKAENKESSKGASKTRTAKEERFKRRGKQWLGIAAAVVIGYVLLFGGYIDLDPQFYFEDEDEEDGM